MEDLYVDQVMSRPAETVTRTTSVRDAAAEMRRHGVGAVVVTDERDGLEGLLTATDFVVLVGDGSVPPDASVAEVMRTDVVTTRPGAPLGEAVGAMLDHRIHHVPVVDAGAVTGMVSAIDVAASLSGAV
jgi:CBS domain-containing protein